MPTETTSKGKLGEMERLVSSLAANAAELPHLETSRNQLDALLDQARDAADRQALHTAGKQEASRKLRTTLTEGMRLAIFSEISSSWDKIRRARRKSS